MEKKKIISVMALLMVVSLTGCTTTNLSDININKAEPNCARQCTANYSQCISGWTQIGFRTETLTACKEALKLCVQTCPDK